MSSFDPGRHAAPAPIDVTDDSRLAEVPRGALALAACTAGLLLLAWLAVYFGLFLARGGVH